MIKKILSATMALAMLFVASCQNELDTTVTGGDTSVVTFNIQSPELSTRGYSDGTTAKKLYYAVYDVYFNNGEGNTNAKYLEALSDLEGKTTIEKSTSVQLELVTGNKYKVIFCRYHNVYLLRAINNAPTIQASNSTLTTSKGRT